MEGRKVAGQEEGSHSQQALPVGAQLHTYDRRQIELQFGVYERYIGLCF